MTDKHLVVLRTADGSATCLHPEHSASYRSVHGAIEEVNHVFIDSTIHPLLSTIPSPKPGRLRVLELGFGLGTSCAQTILFAQKHNIFLEYVSVDRELVPPQFAQHPNTEARSVIEKLLAQFEDENCRVASLEKEGAFSLKVIKDHFSSFQIAFQADAIYFDPFGPKVNPESWSIAVFQHLKQFLSPTGRLATYSAAGHVRRALASAGFILASRPGPGKKREITVAALNNDALLDFERLSMKRYCP